MECQKIILSIFTLIAMCCVNVSAVVIVNPSFEDNGPGSFLTPTGWTLQNSSDFGEGVKTFFPTHGYHNFYVYSFAYSVC